MAEHFDVVIIGGGIHGVGVAQAAACDGYSVLVIEKTGLAAGTSSRSSKLIHGGLRYLEGFDLVHVRENLQERALLLKLAPELVSLRPFYLPVYSTTSRSPLTIRAGLSLYALLGGLHSDCRFRKLRAGEWDALDGLETNNLQAVFRYFDAQTNDADLTRAVMQSAVGLGATLACPAVFVRAEISPGGCAVNYMESGTDRSCTAAVLVNAGGPWVNSISEHISPAPPVIDVDLVQGAHLIVEGGLENGCYYMEVPTDKRAIFLLPWNGNALLGTTETVYAGNPDNVSVLENEEDYLLEVMHHYFPHRSPKVLGRFAGLRVLPTSDHRVFRRSREIQFSQDNPGAPRYVSIYGGKLTGYRSTARKLMRLLRRSLPERTPVADTAKLRLEPV